MTSWHMFGLPHFALERNSHALSIARAEFCAAHSTTGGAAAGGGAASRDGASDEDHPARSADLTTFALPPPPEEPQHPHLHLPHHAVH